MSEFKAGGDAAFQPGDLVAHKADKYRPWVVAVVEGGRIFCSNGVVVDAPSTGSGVGSGPYPVRVPFFPCELEPYSPSNDGGRRYYGPEECCTPPHYAAENGQYDEWDEFDPAGWTITDERVFDTELNRFDPDADVAELVSLGELLREAAKRLADEGFPKLAGAVDVIRSKYEQGDDSGKAVL